jgi:hypothetical protein
MSTISAYIFMVINKLIIINKRTEYCLLVIANKSKRFSTIPTINLNESVFFKTQTLS